MERLIQDLRFAVRALGRDPGFATVAVLTLGIGIGAATALFSVVHGVLLRPLPYPQPDRIVQVFEVGAQGGRANVADPNFADWAAGIRGFTGMAQFQGRAMSIVGGEEPVLRTVGVVSRDFFHVMGVHPVVGRGFTAEERQRGGAPAVIIGHGFWQEQLGGTADLDGRTLTFGDHVHDIVGVMPPGFDFPHGAELWIARELLPVLPSRTALNWQVVARLEDGVSVGRAQRELSEMTREMKARFGDDIWAVDAAAVPLHEQVVGRVQATLLVLLGAAGFLLLVAVVNLANLSVARMAARQREMAVRVALGADRRRLLRQMVTESLTLAVAGALVGLVLAGAGLRLLLAVEPGNLPRVDEIGLSLEALAVALAIAVATALGIGLAAAVQAGRTVLSGGAAVADRTRTAGTSMRRVQGGLVTAQVALTFVLLVGAGLLGRSILRLLDVDLGFRTDGIVAMSLSHPATQGRALANVHDDIIAGLRAIPGVRAAGGSNRLPLWWGGANGTFIIQSHAGEIEGFEDWVALARNPERTGEAVFRVATDGFFAALEIPLLRGRLFDERDDFDAPHVALINDALARSRWPGEDPVGKLINFANMDGDLQPMMIVGIVGDVRDLAIDAEPAPAVYASALQRPGATSDFTYVVAGPGGPAMLIAAARRIAGEVAPTAPPRLRTIEEVVAAPLAPRRFSLVLLSVFGATALLLAALGLYGVIAHSVVQRRRELGIRIALGAVQGRVLGLVVRQGTTLAVLGIGIGVATAAALTRFIASQLYGVATTDLATFAAATTFLLVVAIVASYIPARRAARVDPMIALRED